MIRTEEVDKCMLDVRADRCLITNTIHLTNSHSCQGIWTIFLHVKPAACELLSNCWYSLDWHFASIPVFLSDVTRVICEPSVPVNIQNQRRQISSTLQHNRTTFSNLRSSEACTDVLTVRMWKWRLRLKVCAIMKLKTPALATMIAGAETATWNPRQDCCGYQDAEERDDHDGSPENDIHLPLPRPCGGGQPPLPRPI